MQKYKYTLVYKKSVYEIEANSFAFEDKHIIFIVEETDENKPPQSVIASFPTNKTAIVNVKRVE